MKSHAMKPGDVFMENVADKNNCLGCLVCGTISISALLSQMTWESLLPSGFWAVNLLLTSKQNYLDSQPGVCCNHCPNVQNLTLYARNVYFKYSVS